jgi:hypothetical protein
MLVHDRVHAVPTSRARPGDLEASAGHLLRLCLDLQLDALLLTLGALAADRAQDAEPHEGSAPAVAGSIPWHRWITEDVDLACRLAAEALTGNAALPPSLGSDLGHAVPETIIDDLLARYTSMVGLLRDLSISTAHRTGGTALPGDVDDAIARTEARLAELREHRLLATPPSGIDMRTAHQFLPGELLG